MARRTSPLSLLFELGAAAVGAIYALATFEAVWLLVVSAVLGAVGIAAFVTRWWYRTYTVTEDQLLLDEGVVQRRHRVVPFARVQQVNVDQQLLHRLFSVASLQIETAGEGSTTAVDLKVLSLADAEALRTYVLDRRQAAAFTPTPDPTTTGPAPAADAATGQSAGPRSTEAQGPPTPTAATEKPPPTPRTLATMSPQDLMLAGATDSTVLAVVGLYLVLAVPWATVGLAAELGAWLGVLLALVLLTFGTLVVALVTAGIVVGLMLVGEWEWTLNERGDDLEVRRGLLEVRTESLPRRRVQQVAIVDNPLRRLVGVVSVVLHTAAPAGSSQHSLVQVPLVRRTALAGLVSELLGQEWSLPELEPRPAAARTRAVRRRVLLLAVLLVVPLAVRPDVLWITVPLVVAGVPWGRMAHRRAGLAVSKDRVVLASGVLHHRIDLAPRARLQSTRTSCSPFQRRAGLATLYLDLAGTSWRGSLQRSVRLFDVDANRAARLHRQLPRPAAAPGPTSFAR